MTTQLPKIMDRTQFVTGAVLTLVFGTIGLTVSGAWGGAAFLLAIFGVVIWVTSLSITHTEHRERERRIEAERLYDESQLRTDELLDQVEQVTRERDDALEDVDNLVIELRGAEDRDLMTGEAL